MSTKFYNQVAQKFGNYHTQAKYNKEFLDGDPEAVFKRKLLELSSRDKSALDMGCADGRFTLSIASYFKKITAIDLSAQMLKAARRNQQQVKINNVFFQKQNATQTAFTDNSFDIIYSRRGPTPYQEIYRLLKPAAHFVGIEIGEQDCVEIKKIFGRGQGFNEWHQSRLALDGQKIKKLNFEIIFARDYFYNEYYASYQDLDLFLQGVPIFEDFDCLKDENFLTKYVNKFQSDKGIRLPRHRVVITAQKKV